MKSRLSTSFFVFLVFLVVGISLGYIIGIGQGDYEDAEATPFVSKYIAEQKTQVNILFVFLSDLTQPTTRLEGAWLAVTQPASNRIQFIPVYPALPQPPQTKYFSLPDPFIIETSPEINYSTVSPIINQNINWDYEITIDYSGLTTIVSLAEPYPSKANGIMSKQPKAWKRPVRAIKFQKSIIQFLCDNANNLKTPDKFKKVLSLQDDRTVISISRAETVHFWKKFQNDPNELDCEFPQNTYPQQQGSN